MMTISYEQLTTQNQQLFNTLSSYWIQRGWFDTNTQVVSTNAIIEILYDLAEVSESEVIDLLQTSLRVIENNKSQVQKDVKISMNTFFGDKNFKYTVMSSSESEIAKNIKAHLESEGLEPKVYLEMLYVLKRCADSLAEINLNLKFDAKTSEREIFKVIKAYPDMGVEGEGENRRYSVKYRLDTNAGESIKVKPTDIAGDRGYLLIGNKYILLDDDILPAIVRQRNLQRLNPAEASAIFSNPTQSLFPAGTDTSLFDMSEYDKRVASFEIAPRTKFKEIVSSSVAWYNTDAGNVPYIQIKNEDGNTVKVEISENVLNGLIAKMETSVNSGILLADGNPRPVADDNGNLISSSNHNLSALRTFRDVLRNSKTSKLHEPGTSRGTRVAVLQEVEIPILDSINDVPELTAAEMTQFMNPDNNKIEHHQVGGINWLLRSFFAGKGGVFLCDDMGLGKTLQMLLFFTIIRNLEKVPKLSHLAEKVPLEKPSLVVAPLILLDNWQNEISKFIKPEFQMSVYKLHGAGLQMVKTKDGLKKDWWRNFNLILSNYKTFASYQVDLLKYPYLIAAFDESQNIKNPEIAQSKAARGLNTEFVICATGTPVEIRLMDLWSQTDALRRRPLNPLGRDADFANEYEKSNDGIEKLREIIKINTPDGLMIRRDKQLLRDAGKLKEKIIHEPLFVRMSPEQEAQEQLIITSNKGNQLKILQNLQKLYQHPYLLRDEATIASVDTIIKESPKLQKTLEIIDQIKASGEKVLIFTLWTRMQSLLQEVFKERYGLRVEVINGDINARARTSDSSPATAMIQKFSDVNGFNLMILSPLAAGAGLNITAANHVIHYGRWWNHAKEDQSTDRAYRMGQQKPVYVYYPVLESSTGEGFDKKLDQRVRDRRKMAYDILTPLNSFDSSDEFN
jgi:hypothetical protein